MNGDIEKIIEVLNQAEVRYLVVGGVAVVLHGHLRTTFDLDLVLQLEPANLQAALPALASVGLKPSVPVALEDFANPTMRERWRHEKNMLVLSLWNPANPTQKIDLFIAEPFDFNATYKRAAKFNFGATEAPVIALEDLILMKEHSGRSVDLADIVALEALRPAKES